MTPKEQTWLNLKAPTEGECENCEYSHYSDHGLVDCEHPDQDFSRNKYCSNVTNWWKWDQKSVK